MRIAIPTTAITALLIGLPAAVGNARVPGVAHASHRQSGNADAHLHYIRAAGSTLIEEGSVSGSISGHMRAVLDVGATFSGRFTFYTRGGRIYGHGSAHVNGSHRAEESFAGTDVVTGGSGRYAHARGHGHMYGTYNQRNYAVVIQTRGTLSY